MDEDGKRQKGVKVPPILKVIIMGYYRLLLLKVGTNDCCLLSNHIRILFLLG